MHTVSIPDFILEANQRRRGRVHALERIDPRRTALLVIDMQHAWLEPGFSMLEIPAARTIVDNINRIAAALRDAGGTVAFTQHAWGDWPEFYDMFTRPGFREDVIPKTAPGTPGHELWKGIRAEPGDLRVVKNRPSAFIQGSSDLDARLRARGIDTLIITGTLTNACCEASARDAAALNYKVIFVGDATATRSDVEHNAALINVMQFVADLWMTDELIGLIGRG
ncbi:MAG: cysteine hydrolase [Rhodobacteraceae bacterium]|jgi:ureidoacrylate peracid hydrolase|nr:cysteine hydrolase [Paracoccaceae bacterium]